MAIPPYSPQTFSLFDNYPRPGFIPPEYIPAPDGVPQMGKHWLDVMSPEFAGQTFTKTFVYGSYNGAVIFYEPMVTKAYIESGHFHPYTSAEILLAHQYILPTQYNIYTDDNTGKHYISLSGFVRR